MLPNWADGYEDFLDSTIDAHGAATNLPASGSTGDHVHIGIVDSVCSLPNQLARGREVNQGDAHSFIDSEQDMTHPHGQEVFNLISAYCPNATFSIYQAVREDQTLPLLAHSEAIETAISDGVDILNISAGDPWPGPIQDNPNVSITQKAIGEGITVVASAGNAGKEENRPPVHCPAAIEEVTAVAGFMTICPAEPNDEPSEDRRGPYYYLGDETMGLCARQGCVDGASCISEQTEEEWGGNPQPTREN